MYNFMETDARFIELLNSLFRRLIATSKLVQVWLTENSHKRPNVSGPGGFVRRYLVTASIFLISLSLVNCNSKSANPPAVPEILLFTGTGASQNDVAAIEAILDSSHLDYATASSAQLNDMPESQLSKYHLFIVPGGNFVDMGNGLTGATTTNVRKAVTGGLNYLGICAGGFLAGSLPAPYKSFNLSSGVQFRFFSSGTRKAVVRITTAEGPVLDQYWEDGPQFSGWGHVVGRYPDGTPAIVEGTVGQGQVILSGIHSEAPESWRRGMVFDTPVGVDNAYARRLIVAALDRAALPHY